ncbi:MAG: hypothetical protein Q9164_002701 [Protoblastenia rupestris]
MLAAPPRRRPILLILSIVAFLYLILHLGPPVFAPASKATASRWAQNLNNDLASLYHTSHGDENPQIRQATMLFEGDKDNLRSMYERSVQTHVKHGEKWGVPTHVLKQSLVAEGSYFNKPAFLLNLVLTEMAKPKGWRAEWIVYYSLFSLTTRLD